MRFVFFGPIAILLLLLGCRDATTKLAKQITLPKATTQVPILLAPESPSAQTPKPPKSPSPATEIKSTEAINPASALAPSPGRQLSSQSLSYGSDDDDGFDNGGIHTVEDLCSAHTVDKYQAIENENKQRWQQLFEELKSGIENVHKQLEDWKLDIVVFAEWLTHTEHVETLVQVLIVMGSMRVPICFTLDTLKQVQGSGPILKEIHKLDNDNDDDGTDDGGIRAYMFGNNGLVPLLLTDTDGALLECAASLQQQTEVGQLLQQTIESLAKHANEKSFKTMVHSIVNELTVTKGGIKEMVVTAWNKEIAKLTWHNVEQGMEKFAVWLIAPMHVEFAIKVVLYITDLNTPISLSLNILSAFGLDSLLITYMEKAGAKMIQEGPNKQLVMWAFGPNGVVPLFIRNGSETTDQMPVYEDHNGQSYTKVELEKLYKSVDDEKAFMQHIMEEIVQHQGHPFHELIDHVVVDFNNAEKNLAEGMHRMALKMDKEWEKIKALQLSDVEAGLKSVVMYLITPAHVNKMLRVVLSLTGVDSAVYLTLETMQALHITDYLEDGLLATDKALDDWKFIKQHKQLVGAVDFMIGKDGLVPLFLKDGVLGDYSRASRTTDEATLVGTVIEAVSDNQTPIQIAATAWAFVVKKFTANFTTLKMLQKWNQAQEMLNAKSSEWYEELSELKKQKIAEQQVKEQEAKEKSQTASNNSNKNNSENANAITTTTTTSMPSTTPNKKRNKGLAARLIEWMGMISSKRAYNTTDSQDVSVPSTKVAQRCLTCQTGRDGVLSTRYGRKR